MAYIGKQPTVGNFQVCDAISVVNGQAAYTLQVGGVNVAPESANHMLVSLNGILQKPGSSFTISGSTMTFASNLATGDVIDFVQILGNVLDIGQPSDDTVTAAKLNNDIISGQTALTSSPDDTDELLISDAGTIKRIDVSLVGGKNTPFFCAVKASQTTGQSDNTWTKITFDTEVQDSDGTFASDKFTPAVAGNYYLSLIATGGTSAASSVTSIAIKIYKNGSEITGVNNTSKVEDEVELFTISTSAIITSDTDDYFEAYIKIDKSSNTNRVTSAQFLGYKLIE